MSTTDYVILPKADYVAACDKIRERTGKSDLIKSGDMAGEIESIPSGGSGGGGAVVDKEYVNFYDYDGTLLYSYDAEEVAAMTELPPLPEQKGLICQGWNWTLDDIKAEGKETNVGALYVTDDGKTRLCITTGSDNLSVVLCITASGTVDVDWGDGSAIEQLTGAIEQTHVYTNAGDYTITLDTANDLYLGKGQQYYPVVYIPRSDGVKNTTGTSLLRKVYIGNYVTRINNSAFHQCYSLTSITIPNSVTVIAARAFYECYSLTSITIPNGITGWQMYVFYNCLSLRSIAMPNSVTSISNFVFMDCQSLTRITIPNSVTAIYDHAFNGCQSLTRITIPAGLPKIYQYTFNECSSLTSITIPNGVTSLDGNAFGHCSSLTSITIPNSVTNIGYSAFYQCYSLMSITIPDSVTSISSYVFYNCYLLKLIDFSTHTAVPALTGQAFYNVPVPFEIRVPAALYDEWIAATNWSTYADQIVAV